VAHSLAKEQGIEGAVHAFYKHLPLEKMLCDISLFKGQYRLAQIYCPECRLKMTKEVYDRLHPHIHTGSTNSSDLSIQECHPCVYQDYTMPKPQKPKDSLVQGLGGFVHELAEGVAEAVYDPVKGAYEDGLSGGAAGLVKGLHRLLNHQIKGSSILVERIRDLLPEIRGTYGSNLFLLAGKSLLAIN
jgi:hypothetical protein